MGAPETPQQEHRSNRLSTNGRRRLPRRATRVCPTSMTTTPSAPPPSRSFPFGKLVLGVLAGFALTLAFGAGALLAYQGQYADRVYPGVSVAGVDVSGLSRADAAARLGAELAGYGEGSVVLTVDGTEITLPYAALGRRADVERLVELAWSVGRDHPDPIGRAAQGVRSLLDGTHIDPLVVLDAAAVDRAVTEAALRHQPGSRQRLGDRHQDRLRGQPGLGRADLPARRDQRRAPRPARRPGSPGHPPARLPDHPGRALHHRRRRSPPRSRPPTAWRRTSSWRPARRPGRSPGATVRGWISFATTTEGYRPTIAPSAPRKALTNLAKKIDTGADGGDLHGRPRRQPSGSSRAGTAASST